MGGRLHAGGVRPLPGDGAPLGAGRLGRVRLLRQPLPLVLGLRHRADLHTDMRCYNRLLIALRAPTERAYALLGYWRALDRITVCPWRIGIIVAASPPLTVDGPAVRRLAGGAAVQAAIHKS